LVLERGVVVEETGVRGACTNVWGTGVSKKTLYFVVGMVVGNDWFHIGFRESAREMGGSGWNSAWAETALRVAG